MHTAETKARQEALAKAKEQAQATAAKKQEFETRLKIAKEVETFWDHDASIRAQIKSHYDQMN